MDRYRCSLSRGRNFWWIKESFGNFEIFECWNWFFILFWPHQLIMHAEFVVTGLKQPLKWLRQTVYSIYFLRFIFLFSSSTSDLLRSTLSFVPFLSVFYSICRSISFICSSAFILSIFASSKGMGLDKLIKITAMEWFACFD